MGTITSLDPVAAVFTVRQVRAGSLDGYIDANYVEVRYGRDVKYLEKNKTYIVGVALDSVTSKLSSTIRDSNELFGGAEVVGSMCGVRNSKQQHEHCTTTAPALTLGYSLPSLINQPGYLPHWYCQRCWFFWRY